jgi:hypothetical protein
LFTDILPRKGTEISWPVAESLDAHFVHGHASPQGDENKTVAIVAKTTSSTSLQGLPSSQTCFPGRGRKIVLTRECFTDHLESFTDMLSRKGTN